jgi:hypothetical protein
VFILQTSKEARKTDIYAIEELAYAHRFVVPCFVILRSQICPGKENAGVVNGEEACEKIRYMLTSQYPFATTTTWRGGMRVPVHRDLMTSKQCHSKQQELRTRIWIFAKEWGESGAAIFLC